MKNRHALQLCLVVAVFAVVGQYLSRAAIQFDQSVVSDNNVCWQANHHLVQTDACPESRHLERGGSTFEVGQGRRSTTPSIILASLASTFARELLTCSDRHLRLQQFGLQVPIQVLQCTWLI